MVQVFWEYRNPPAKGYPSQLLETRYWVVSPEVFE